MTGNINENDDDNDLGYTPVLSKYFPSFVGVCRQYEFRKAFWRALFMTMLFAAMYSFFVYGILANFGTLPISQDSSIDWPILICCGVLWYLMVGLTWFRMYSKRLHAFGKSATCWLMIPTATLYLTQFLLEISGRELPVIVELIHLVYVVYLFCLCFFGRAGIDASVVANPAHEALLERLKKKNVGTRTGKTIKAVKPTPPTPPSHQ